MSLHFDLYERTVYYCPECEEETSNPEHGEWAEPCCPNGCEHFRLEPIGTRKPAYLTVAVYLMDRAYGGPEEGGWYYDVGYLVSGTQRSFLAEDAPQVEVYLNTLAHRLRSDEQIRVWPDKEALKYFPEQRPYYN
jgi:hypothetical protein